MTKNLLYDLPNDVRHLVDEMETRLKFKDVVDDLNTTGKAIVKNRWIHSRNKYLLFSDLVGWDGGRANEFHEILSDLIDGNKMYKSSPFKFIDDDIIDRYKFAFGLYYHKDFDTYKQGDISDDVDVGGGKFSEMCMGLDVYDLSNTYINLTNEFD